MGTECPLATHHRIDNASTSTKTMHPRPAKRLRPNTSKPHPTHPGGGVNSIKARVRDVTRLLERSNDLPPGVRIEKERALARYRQDLAEAEAEKRKQQMISKYHMVRFFERQKATRTLRKLKARVADVGHGSAEYQELQIAVHVAEVDINYALYHPLDEKYRSLYPRKGNNVVSAEHGLDNSIPQTAGTIRPAIWGVVEKCMSEGTLEALRDGKMRKSLPNRRPRQHISRKARLQDTRKEIKLSNEKGAFTKKTATQAKEDDSDGGFFEE